MIQYIYLNNFTPELNTCNCICDAMINDSRCISFYTSTSIYCWNHIARKYLIQNLLNRFISFKVSNTKTEVSYKYYFFIISSFLERK